tara:strand:- start:14265 stop:15104 length:840 start_codon:yes stop_codon:yes gene_type:complete
VKVFPFKIPKTSNDVLILQEDIEEVFYDKLHQHQEIQISYIVKGQGTLLVGDAVDRYNEGDVLVFGSNLPHVFKSDPIRDSYSHMRTVFFDINGFGEQLFKSEEFKELEGFFTLAQAGFKINRPTIKYSDSFNLLWEKEKLERTLLFFQILNMLNKDEKTLLSSFGKNRQYGANEGERMSRIFHHLMNNFKNDISLREIAEVSALSPTAFCRFFKQRTKKTFSQFLLELRIEHACRLLSKKDSQMPITAIAYDCGFNSISNFNRYFKKIKGISPRNYTK